MRFPTFEFPPLFELLLRASWQAGLLVFVVLAMQRTLRGRLTPAWRHALWWVVLGRLLIPITPPSTWSLFNLIPTPANQRILSQGSLASSSGWQPVVARSASGASIENIKPAAPRAVGRELTLSPGVPGASPAMSIGSAIALAWAVVALFLLCRIGFQNLWFSRRVRSSMQPADPDLLTLLDECRTRMRIKRRIDLLQGDAVSSPAVFGMLRPRILLPQQLARTCRPGQLRHILLHELAHIRRGDSLVHGLTRVLQALHWFNPVLAWAFRRLRADREIATDALALEVAGEQEIRAYGLTIVQLLQRWVAHPAQPNTVGILEDSTYLERRIRAIATYRPPSRWAPVASILIVALAAASWTSAQTDGPPEAASLHPLVGSEPTEQLLKEATQKMESGDLEAAQKKVEVALELDPRSERANHILKLIQDGYSAVEAGRRNSLGELGLRQNAKTDQLASETPASIVSRPKATTKDRQRIMALLESIRIPEVGFDRRPLEAVVRQLRDLARANDPEGKGLNFFMNPYLDNVLRPDPRVVVDPETGATNQPSPHEPLPLNDILVRIDPPLRDVRLLDVLRALTLSASVPISFTVEDYAVVFTYKPPRHASLVTKVFRTNPERLSTGLESTMNIRNSDSLPTQEIAGTSSSLQEKVRRLFEQLGISVLPPNAVFFNDRLGLLMVRAHLEEMEAVEAAIEGLNAIDQGPTVTHVLAKSNTTPSSVRAVSATSTSNVPTIAEIVISRDKRLRRMPENQIHSYISSKSGATLNRETIDADVRSLYKSGLFKAIRVAESSTPKGIVLEFVLQERPLLKKIILKGNSKLSSDRLSERLLSHVGSPVDEQSLFRDAENIAQAYRDSGIDPVKVKYIVEPDEEAGQAVVLFEILE